MPNPKVAVVVPVHGRLAQTLRFIESFRRVEYDAYELVIVDDASPDDTAVVLGRDHPDVVVLPGDGKLWWTGGTNLGVRYALDHGFDYVLTINNNTCVAPPFLTSLVETAERRAPCVVGCRIQFLDQPRRVWGVGATMHWADAFSPTRRERDSDEAELLARLASPVPVDMLPGCGALVPAACYRAVGLYDGRMFPHYHADSEFTLRRPRRLSHPGRSERRRLSRRTGNDPQAEPIPPAQSPMYWRPLLAMYLATVRPAAYLRCWPGCSCAAEAPSSSRDGRAERRWNEGRSPCRSPTCGST